MAKLLISCDDVLFYHEGEYYFKDEEWHKFYKRYLRIFENLKIVVRVVYEECLLPKRIKVDDSRIEIVHIENFSGPFQYAKVYGKIGKSLQNITDGCDAAVIRVPSTIGQRVAQAVIASNLPYAVEVVYDAEDGWRSEKNLVHKFLWMNIDRQMRGICNKADGVSCVTEYYLQRHYFSKKTGAFKSHYSTLELAKSFYTGPKGFPTKTPYVVTNVANQIQFKGRKGFNEIIEAIRILKDRGVKVIAKFVGQSYRGGVEKLQELSKKLGVDDQIEYMGYLSRLELDSFLSNVDVFVMPTRAEGLPRVVIEAMAKGLPVITTPVSGNPELVSEHFLVEYEDINKLADRIQELLTNRLLYEATSKENFENSIKYEASALEKRRDDFYSKLKDLIK